MDVDAPQEAELDMKILEINLFNLKIFAWLPVFPFRAVKIPDEFWKSRKTANIILLTNRKCKKYSIDLIIFGQMALK